MISRYKYKNLTWIDLDSPTKEEIFSLMEEFNITALIGDELIKKSLRSKVDFNNNLIYLILHFPTTGTIKGEYIEQEIDFIIGKNFIITTHYELIDPLYEFSKLFEVSSILDKSNIGDHAGFLFFYIIKELYKHSMFQLENIYDELKRIEKNIFQNKEGEVVKTISDVNRQLLNFKQAIRFHDEVLKSFESAGIIFFGEKFNHHLLSIISEYNKVQNTLNSNKEMLDDLQATNDSLLTNKTNEIMKKLTILTFIILPLTFIAEIFGMNIAFFDFKHINRVVLIIIGMIIIAFIMFFYFKAKKWL